MFGFDNLCVVNVSWAKPAEIQRWNDHNVIAVTTCARKTWIGQTTDFEDFPFAAIPEGRGQYLVGPEAYEFLLRLKCGLESPKLGETSIDGQFLGDAAEFGQRCPDKFAKMSRLMEMLTIDTRHIRANFIEHLDKACVETSSKILSGFKKGDRIIIIGKTGRNDAVSQITLNLALTMKNASEICYTAFSPETIPALMAAFKSASIRTRIPMVTPAIATDFADVPALIKKGSHVFIDNPMGENTWQESKLMGDWRSSAQAGFSMIHLRGSPSLMGGSTKAWKNAELPQYFAPEDVRERKIQIDSDNRTLLARADADIAKIAAARSEGSTANPFRIINGFKPRAASNANAGAVASVSMNDPSLAVA